MQSNTHTLWLWKCRWNTFFKTQNINNKGSEMALDRPQYRSFWSVHYILNSGPDFYFNSRATILVECQWLNWAANLASKGEW